MPFEQQGPRVGEGFVSSTISNCPSAILAWIFSAAISAARLLLPIRLALRFPLLLHYPFAPIPLKRVCDNKLVHWSSRYLLMP
jgi:hypothetical protein